MSGRTAIVTGGGQGVGLEVCLMLAKRGIADRIAVVDVNPERADKAALALSDEGASARPFVCDVTDFDAVVEMVAEVELSFGAPGILVNNAGNAGASGLSEEEASAFVHSTPQDWAPWMGANLFGVMNCTRAVLRPMIAAEYGRIVTVVSDAGRVGDRDLVAYSAAKAGAAGFMRSVARLAGRHGVTANCVSLGTTITDRYATWEAGLDAEQRKVWLRNYMIKRFGTPADGAAAICYFASEEAGWVTAQTLAVSGGFSVTM